MPTCLERVKHFVDENGVKYEIQRHREAFTMQEVAAALHEAGAHVAKVIVAWADQKLVLLVLPASARVDFERVRQILKVQAARCAREEEFKHVFPDCDVGAMPPFGHFYDIPVYLDRALTAQPQIVFQAGTHRDTLKIATLDYLRLAEPTLAEFCEQPEAAAAQ